MPQSNPVHARLTRHAWRLTRAALQRITIATALLTTLPVLAAIIFDPAAETPLVAAPIAVVVVAFAAMLLSLPVVLMLTAILTAREIAHEDFTYLKLTNVTPKQVVDAYLTVADLRLELLRALSWGVVPGLSLSFCYPLVLIVYKDDCSIYRDCLGNIMSIVLFGLVLSAGGLAIAGLYAVMAWRFALHAGIWSAVRWGHNAPFVAGGMLVAVIALCIGMGFAAVLPLLWIVLLCFVPLGIPIACHLLNSYFMTSALQAIERR